MALSTALVLVVLWCFVLVAWCFMCYTHSVYEIEFTVSILQVCEAGGKNSDSRFFLLSHCNGLRFKMQKLCIFHCVLFPKFQAYIDEHVGKISQKCKKIKNDSGVDFDFELRDSGVAKFTPHR